MKYTEFDGGVYFSYFRPEILYLGKFGPWNQNCQFKLKFGTQHNSNMQNSMVVFPLLVQTGNTLFGEIWSNKSKLSVQDETWKVSHYFPQSGKFHWISNIDRSKNIFCPGIISGNSPKFTKNESRQISDLIILIGSPFKCDHLRSMSQFPCFGN